MAKYYDTGIMNILTAKSNTAPNDRKVYGSSWRTQDTRGKAADTGRFKYSPSKTGKISEYRNQGFDRGGKRYSETQRNESYNKWLEKGSRVSGPTSDPVTHIGHVQSSWLTSLGYNAATGEAVATFRGTSAEFYYKMPFDMYLEWLNAPSKGKWLHDHPGIMHNYSIRDGAAKGGLNRRYERLYKASRKRTNIDGTEKVNRAKARVRQYLEKWR